MRVFVKSFGCSTNLADGEVLAGCLAKADNEIVNSVLLADVVVYNTCAVKGPTENRMINVLRKIPREKKLVVAGCLPLINFERIVNEVRFDGVVGPVANSKIVDVVRRVSSGEKVIAIKTAMNAKPNLCLPRAKLNSVIDIIPVSYGCLGSCAYCCVVFARGRLRSCSIREVVDRVKKSVTMGMREFWITSQDTACYGRDIGTNLAELLKALCDVEGNFKIRVGMMIPNIVKDILDDLIDAYKSEKVFKFAHLPVQSGNNQVLKRMRRFYSAEDFKQIVGSFRKVFPDLTLATDVICGFPGETREAFRETLQFIEDVQPDIVNVSKFFARPRTAAAEMKEDSVALSEVKQRSTSAAKLARKVALERNRRWVGWSGEILVDEVGKVPASWVGRNYAYKPVVVRSVDDLLGRTVNVKIVDAFSSHLKGEIL